jgi:hypothetical protein
MDEPHAYLVGCKHPEFPSLKLPEGSIVIDPFRYMPDQDGVEVIRIGARENGSGAAEKEGQAAAARRRPQSAGSSPAMASHRGAA